MVLDLFEPLALPDGFQTWVSQRNLSKEWRSISFKGRKG